MVLVVRFLWLFSCCFFDVNLERRFISLPKPTNIEKGGACKQVLITGDYSNIHRISSGRYYWKFSPTFYWYTIQTRTLKAHMSVVNVEIYLLTLVQNLTIKINECALWRHMRSSRIIITDKYHKNGRGFPLVKCIRHFNDLWNGPVIIMVSIHFWQRYVRKRFLHYRSQWHCLSTFDL